MTADDRPAVDAVLGEAGFKVRSAAGWDWLWQGNPDGAPEAPRGWVVETDRGIEGYLGSLVRHATFAQAELRVAVSADWYVRESARAHSTTLLRAFFRQPDVDLAVSTTANDASGPVYAVYKARTPPHPCFRTSRVWVADDRALAAAAAQRAGVGWLPGLSAVGGAAGRLRRRAGLLHPRAHGRPTRLSEHPPDDLPEALDAHYAAVGSDGRLHPKRTRAVLRWLMTDPDGASHPRLLVAHDHGGIAATVLVACHRAPDHPVAQVRILDVTAAPRPGAAAAVGALLQAGAEHGRRHGAALLFAPPCGPRVSALLARCGGHEIPRAAPAHYARARKRRQLPALLDAWEATGISGDAPLCLRPAAAG